MSEFVTVHTSDGDFQAYVARPEQEKAPVVVVVQEIFGINDDIKATCNELAESGYIALSPDLFWRQEPGLSLSHWSEAEWKKGLALYAAFDVDKGVEDVGATIAGGRMLPGSTGRVGVMGYCLGGLVTFLTASRVGADAAVEYYGGGTEKYAVEGKDIATPMIIHLGEEDEFISKEAQATIKMSVADNPNVKVFSYPGCSHAFARHTGTRYDADAAKLANARTWAFFDEHLR